MGLWPKLISARGWEALQSHVAELQHAVDAITGQVAHGTDANPYPTYDAQVRALSDKYEGKGEYGNHQVGAIIDVRSAFILGLGVNVAEVDGAGGDGREIDFINNFIRHNRLDLLAQRWAREAEIEGKCLIRLRPDGDQVRAQWIPWSQHRYTVDAAPDDYATYRRVTYKVNGTGNPVVLPASQFAYQSFGGRTHNVNECPPRIGRVLRLCESLDRALMDWRRINNLFACPTPYFKMGAASEAEGFYQKLRKMNWKIGKFLCGTADFSMVGPDGAGVQSLENEIITIAKIISGATAVPVHFLGLPDLMSNRATADNLFELVVAGTTEPRLLWVALFTDLFRKALEMANETLKKGFKPRAVEAQVPEASSAKLKELVDVWLPLYAEGVVSLEFLLGKIPDVDPEEEMARVAEAKAEAVAQTVAAMRAGDGVHGGAEDPDDEPAPARKRLTGAAA